jgi:hypothetical protein
MRSHQQGIEVARRIFRRLPRIPSLGITDRQFAEFDRFTFRCALEASRTSLWLRDRIEGFVEGVKK